MSYSSLWTIDKNWNGNEHVEYKNSNLFAPITWNILFCKYIPRAERKLEFPRYLDGKKIEYETNYMIWVMPLFSKNNNGERLNEIINNCQSQTDRVLWEFSNLSVFNAKDKEFVATCIEKFVEQNFPNSEYKDCEHIKDRFLNVAKDIRELPCECKYFVFKGTSCDDNVERWFYGDEEDKKLSDWDKWVCEFTLIENNQIVGWSDNLKMCRRKMYERIDDRATEKP